MNPARRSSGSQFYIVQGRDVSAQMLQGVVNSRRKSSSEPFSYTPDQIAAYQELGGTPHLDMQYTVFGRVIEGLDVLDAICAAQVGAVQPAFGGHYHADDHPQLTLDVDTESG